MATTIQAAFEELLAALRNTPAETAAAAAHRSSVEAKLKAVFGITAFFRSGSYGNGTHISYFSDVDYFAVTPRENLKQNSANSLAQFAGALRERFPQTENIRVDSPGVRVPFGDEGAETIEVVPVDEMGRTLLGFRQFEIPDGNGGWMFSAPESHNAFISGRDTQLSGRLKPMIRFLKAWKFFRSVPIKSFYLEVYATHHTIGEKSIVYDIDLASCFSSLYDSGLPDLPDPRFPNDGFVIRPCKTPVQHAEALVKLENAKTWSTHARYYNYNDRVRDAFDRWRLVFNNAFPDYSDR